jgi:hypothetical protein
MALLCSKLSSFDPKISYRSRTLDELDSMQCTQWFQVQIKQ